MNSFIKRIIFISVFSFSVMAFCPFRQFSTLFLPVARKASEVVFLPATKKVLPLLPASVPRPLLSSRRVSITSSAAKYGLFSKPARITFSRADLSNFVFTSLKKNIKSTEFKLSLEKGLVSSCEYLFRVQVFLLSELKTLDAQNDDPYLYRIFIGNEPEIIELQNELMTHNTSISRDIFVYRDSKGGTIVSRNGAFNKYGFLSLAFENIAQQLREELIGQHYILGA